MAVVWFVDAQVVERRLGEQRTAVIDKLSTTRAEIEAALNSRLSLVEGMAALVKSSNEIRNNQPDIFTREFKDYSAELLKRLKGIRSLQLAPDGVVTYINPLKGNEAAQGHDLRADPARRDAVERAIRERKFIVAGPVELRQGGVALIGRLPIFLPSEGGRKERFWGFSIILIDLDTVLEAGGLLEQATGLRYAIRGKDGLGAEGAVFYGEEALFDENPVVLEVYLPNGSWQIAAVPAEGWGGDAKDGIYLRIFGSALAGVVGFLIFLLLKQAEEAVKASEARLAEIIDIAPEAVITIDSDMNIQLFNQGAERIFGYGADEVVGRPVDILIPEYLRDGHQKHVQGFDGSGDTYRLMDQRKEIIGLQKDGTEFPATASVSKLEAGGEKMYTVMLRDITERKRAEDQIKAALAEKEVLLQEIHHRVKNNLQVISGMLWFQANAENNTHTAEVLRDSYRRVMLMAQIHESLYRQGDLNGINARDLLNTLVSDTKASVGGVSEHLSFHVDVDEIPLDVDHANAYGQIISELIANSLKHAFANGQSGNIEVSLHRGDGGAIELSVTDDGKGLPEDFDLDQTKTLGLQLVSSLAAKLGGETHIDGSGGTRVRINFPEAQP